MRTQMRVGLRCVVFCVLGALSFSLWASVGTVTHLSGVLTSKKEDGSSRVLAVKSVVNEGDVLITEADTYARIKFVDGGEIVLRPGSEFKIDRYAYSEANAQSDNIVMSLFKGGLRAVTGLIGKRNKERVSFQTPTATIGIRGTHFGLLLCNAGSCINVPTTSGRSPADGLHVDVANGAVLLGNPAGQLLLNAGQFGFVGGPNVSPVIVTPEDAHPVTIPNAIRRNRGGGRDIGGEGDTSCGV
jgi:hypothetical protein